jgi:hypothetical protein
MVCGIPSFTLQTFVEGVMCRVTTPWEKKGVPEVVSLEGWAEGSYPT